MSFLCKFFTYSIDTLLFIALKNLTLTSEDWISFELVKGIQPKGIGARGSTLNDSLGKFSWFYNLGFSRTNPNCPLRRLQCINKYLLFRTGSLHQLFHQFSRIFKPLFSGFLDVYINATILAANYLTCRLNEIRRYLATYTELRNTYKKILL